MGWFVLWEHIEMRRILVTLFALSLLAAAVPRAHANDDRVSFLHSIDVAEGEEAHDTVCILCSIRINGAVHGDAVAILGSIRSNGPVDGDTVAILGNVNLGRDARVGGDCVAVLGSVRQSGSNQIGKDIVQLPFVLILIPVLIFFFIIYLIRTLVWRSRLPYPMPPPPPPPVR
jgi:hypothetical protein